MKLSREESLALAAMVRRDGMGAVLEEFAQFARELAAGDEQMASGRRRAPPASQCRNRSMLAWPGARPDGNNDDRNVA